MEFWAYGSDTRNYSIFCQLGHTCIHMVERSVLTRKGGTPSTELETLPARTSRRDSSKLSAFFVCVCETQNYVPWA